MATYPAFPVPNNAGLQTSRDPVLEAQFDGGTIATRSKYLRQRRLFRLAYGLTLDEYFILWNFRQEVRGRALTFDWTYPQVYIVASATATTPIQIETGAFNGLITGDYVNITNVNAQANGIHRVTRLGPRTVSLDGTTGSVTSSSGQLAWHFPKMRLALQNGEWPAPEKLSGPAVDNLAVVQFAVTLEEAF